MSNKLHAMDLDRDPICYAIFDDGGRHLVLRRLPAEEFLMYYRKRRSEILVDRNQDYWLMLSAMPSREAAECWIAQHAISNAVVDRLIATSEDRLDNK